MCKLEGKTCSHGNSVAARSGRRLRIWEVPDGFQCSILGTCLSLEKTKKILAKTHKKLPRTSDYHLHVIAVTAARTDTPTARLIQKALDRAHEVSIKRYAKLRTEEELQAAWAKDVEYGLIPGPFWALMSHPSASQELRGEAFGIIHMLSHRVGAMNHTRLRRFDEVSARAEALESELTQRQSEWRRERSDLESRIAELEAALNERAREAQELRAQLSATDVESIQNLKKEKEARSRALERSERRLRHALETIEALQRAPEVAKPQGLSPSEPPPCAEDCREEGCSGKLCAECDLGGQVILYVGGQRGMLSHLRRVAETANSTLLHHDGGIEDGLGNLYRLCERADAVFFPVDRVSHGATAEVKRACSATGKTFIPLRRASIDAFEKGLHLIAARAAQDGVSSVPPT